MELHLTENLTRPSDSILITWKSKPKMKLLMLVCIAFLYCTAAYPSHKSTSPKSLNLENSRDKLGVQENFVQEEHSWRRAFTHILDALLKSRSQAQDQKSYTDAGMEGITSFFNNLGEKFREFGRRINHAFKPSGKWCKIRSWTLTGALIYTCVLA